MLNRKNIVCCLLVAVIGVMAWPCCLSAATAEEKFYQADAAFLKFKKNSGKQKYRSNWFPYIEKFKAAYKKDPTGPFAPASLFMAGKAYQELHQHSGKGSDKREALDLFKRVVKRFPRSRYKPKAQKGIASLSGRKSKKKEGRKKKVKKKKDEVRSSKIKRKVRKDKYAKLKKQYKAARSRKNIKKGYRPKPKSSSYRASKAATLKGLRFWSTPSYTRVVIDIDGDAHFTHRLLRENPVAGKPQQLFVDFQNTVLARNIKRIITINDDLLNDARAGQYRKGAVRVVVDIKSFKNYKIFPLKNPYRTVIDIWGDEAAGPSYKEPETKYPNVWTSDNGRYPKRNKTRKSKGGDLARQLALGVKRIVIDAGHGGKDVGAVGYYKHVYEKDIVLSVAKRLARKIRKQLGRQVLMTRSTDKFLTLEARTAIANSKKADLFISIHTNAHKNKRAYGIETYILNVATDEDAIRVAQRENAVSRRNLSDLQNILNDLMQYAKIEESSRLASYVQRTLYRNMRKKYSKIKDKGVKQAPFYVLLGARMPCILVELSFISNKRECTRLTQAEYQNRLCDSIVKGIKKYILETKPTALLNPQTANEKI